MKKGLFTVTENSQRRRPHAAHDARRATRSAIVRPGQFVNVEIEGLYLRRPISGLRLGRTGKLVLIYKVVGAGTQQLAGLRPGAAARPAHRPGQRLRRRRRPARGQLLVGGGVGVPPLYGLGKAACWPAGQRGRGRRWASARARGGHSAVDELRAAGLRTSRVATADGTHGHAGVWSPTSIRAAACRYRPTSTPAARLTMLRAPWNNATALRRSN